MEAEFTVICFGGGEDGRVCHQHADPPFGYRPEFVSVDGEERKFFLYHRIDRTDIHLSIIKRAIRAIENERQH